MTFQVDLSTIQHVMIFVAKLQQQNNIIAKERNRYHKPYQFILQQWICNNIPHWQLKEIKR